MTGASTITPSTTDAPWVMLGTVWRDGVPMLRWRPWADAGIPSELLPLRGLNLHWEVRGDRVCLGHVPFRSSRGGYHDCSNMPDMGSRTCERCSIVEATFASNLHHAHTRNRNELDASIRTHLEQPNRLYLASFRDGSIKVGTSTSGRSVERFLEQGAWRARWVADTTDGYRVRELEDLVTEELGLVQAVTSRRKKAGLITPRPDSQLDRTLDDLTDRVHALLDLPGAPLATPCNMPWTNPAIDSGAAEGAIAYPLDLKSGVHAFEIDDVVGKLAIASRPGGPDRFVIDLAPLFGIICETSAEPPAEIAIQDSLF